MVLLNQVIFLKYLMLCSVILVLQFTWGQSRDSFDRKEMFQAGNQYYEMGDYFSAAELYQRILKNSPQAIEVRYNLAQTYYQIYRNHRDRRKGNIVDNGYIALAVLNYEQIVNRNSFDPWSSPLNREVVSYAITNLTEIRKGHGLNAPPQTFLYLITSTIYNYQRTLIHLLGITFILTISSFTLIILNRLKQPQKSSPQKISSDSNPTHPKKIRLFFNFIKSKISILFKISITVYLITLSLILWQGWGSHFIISPYTRAVINDNSSLRKAPNPNTPPFSHVPEGETVDIIETRENNQRAWVKVIVYKKEKDRFEEGWLESNKIWIINDNIFPVINL